MLTKQIHRNFRNKYILTPDEQEKNSLRWHEDETFRETRLKREPIDCVPPNIASIIQYNVQYRTIASYPNDHDF